MRNSDPESYVLYLWRNRPTIVIGRNQNPWKECNLGLMASRGVLLARRNSGGGAVYHDMGNTNYTVVMPRESFTRNTCASLVSRAMHNEDIPTYVSERHDIMMNQSKVSGSAFKLTSKRAMHHGTMLIDADLDRLNGCLRSQAYDEIEALGVDSVRSSVANLRESSYSIDHLTFCNAVMTEFMLTFGIDGKGKLCEWDENSKDIVGRIEEERKKLQTWKWLYGQTPKFTHSFEKQFAWTEVSAQIVVYHGLVTEVNIKLGREIVLDLDSVREALLDAPYEATEIERCLQPVRLQGDHAEELCMWLVEKVRAAASGATAAVS
ncbi:hypothetical protein GGI05_006873, partial [Coemansia sp. RSA 2603]